jgi:hypothetical protein
MTRSSDTQHHLFFTPENAQFPISLQERALHLRGIFKPLLAELPQQLLGGDHLGPHVVTQQPERWRLIS